MKCFLRSILLFCLLSGMMSCGDSGDGDLTGTYELISFATIGCDDPESNLEFEFGNDGCQTIDGIQICGSGSFTFRADGTFSSSFTISALGIEDTITSEGTYSLDGNTLTICEDEECESAIVDVGSNTITFRIPDPPTGCTLILTGKK